jgi:GTP pyrophosphokinase
MNKKREYTVEEVHEIYDDEFNVLRKSVREYLKTKSLSLIERAYNYAIEKHVKQVRKSGEPYFDHLFNVAKILVDLRLDLETIACGFLHDTIEDTEVTYEDISSNFTKGVADLVEGVTKITSLSDRSLKSKQGENFRKLILSTAKDVRVILVKFADRLHNMRTLNHMPPEKRTRISIETRDVYAPLAHRFGLHNIKSELEDLTLKYLHTEVYYELKKKVEQTKKERDTKINNIIEKIQAKLKDANIKAEISGRPKHFFSIYNKMVKRTKPFEEIYDLIAIRIIVENTAQCYSAFGVVQLMFMSVPDRFKDYISTPKVNGYQSLHTTIMGKDGRMLEVQIRSREMHQHAEEGIAAHWRYKYQSTSVSGSDLNLDEKLQKNLNWLHQLVDRQNEMDSEDFFDSLTIDLFKDEVFVYSPKGDLFTLPTGSCILDFAFGIHSDIGLHCKSAKINGKIAQLSTKLKTGDVIEIVTAKNKHPNVDWLNIVVTSKARHYIKRWEKENKRQQNVNTGQKTFQAILKSQHIKNEDVDIGILAKALKKNSVGHFFEGLANNEYSHSKVIYQILKQVGKVGNEVSEEQFESGYSDDVDTANALGIKGMQVIFAKCCSPVPGDIIKGYMTQGRGLAIHRDSCKNFLHLEERCEPSRFLDLNWNIISGAEYYNVRLNIKARNRDGLLNDLTEALKKLNAKIKFFNLGDGPGGYAFGEVVVSVKNSSMLSQIIRAFINTPSVLLVERDENYLEN